MARQISRAEAWERAHEVFTQVNFNSFDYDSIKESLLDYIKLYFAEDFNDYIESSEFIAILESFAYVGELLAYRMDLNAHENFITTAQRKESILRLAKLISYKTTRNIPARGLVKLTSIQTTESVTDSQGRNLSNKRIIWNDGNNTDWKEQFLLVLNRVLEQDFGTVIPSDRVQVDDVLFELYSLNNTPLSTTGSSVLKYSASVNGIGYPMEVTPVTLSSDGPEEKRPERNAKMTILYGSDGLGDGSDTTGFFMFTKQGTLRLQEAFYDGITPNQTMDIGVNDINETDVWINNVHPDTRAVLDQNPYAQILPHIVYTDLRYGDWIEVDVANAQNIIFNTNKNRHKYELETLDNDQVRIIFGDGEFSDIPSGAFDLWYRTSANADIVIPKTSVIDQTTSLSYVDVNSTTQTITLSFSLINSLQNASASEDIEHVRRVAPSVYYTQDRMVNGRDYNVFMLQDPSILKLRSVNRTFAGDSKYIAWHDPKEYYEDVKLFGDDMVVYWDDQNPSNGNLTAINDALTANELLTNYIQPLLCSTDFFSVIGTELERAGKNPADIRCSFNDSSTPYVFDPLLNEVDSIITALNNATTTTPVVDLYYSVIYDEWTVASGNIGHYCDTLIGSPATIPTECTLGPANATWMVRIEAKFIGSTHSGWDVRWRTKKMIAYSETTKFWNTNDTNSVINYDTLNSVTDTVVILQANPNASNTGILTSNHNFGVLGQELIDQNLPNAGLLDENRLSILPVDVNGDGIADNLLQPELFETTYTSGFTVTGQVITLPQSIVQADVEHMDQELEVYVNGTRITFTSGNLTTTNTNVITNEVKVSATYPIIGSPLNVTLIFNQQTYFNRITSIDPWIPVLGTDTIKTLWAVDTTVIADQRRYIRYPGRYPLNFAWFHSTPRLHLVDPATSNIIDTFVVTKGYYTSMQTYLTGGSTIEPTPPSTRELRSSYADLLENKMISDTVIMHPGKFKILFGSKAIPQLRATFKVIRPSVSTLTDNEVKVRIVSVIRTFFDINDWEFGETFFFTELAASIHADLGPEIDSIVIVPTYSQNQFGDMFQVQAREDEMFMPDINTSDIQIVQSYTAEIIRQN